MSGNVRLQFEVSNAHLREMEGIMKDCDLATKKELFTNALTLFKWAVEESKKGAKIAAVYDEEKKIRELTMPVLSAAARSCETMV